MCVFLTAENPVISPNFLVFKFCGKSQFPHSFGRNCTFPKNFNTRELGEITGSFAVFGDRNYFKLSRISNSLEHFPKICILTI